MKGVKFLEIHVPKFEKFKTKTLLLPLLTLTFDQFRLTFYEFKFRVVSEFENVKYASHICLGKCYSYKRLIDSHSAIA